MSKFKRFLSYKHHENFPQHHHYQIAVIFLFVFGIFLFVPYYLVIDEFNLNMNDYQWYFFIPFLIFFTVYCLKERSKIKPEERVNPMKRPIGHWILLGITLIAFHIKPQDNYLEKIQALDISFAIFSLFLADGYWDFKKHVYHRFFRRG
ncbi:hypothetical protein KJ785_04550 [Patescibacteria group bacterium]|nr:hypothetical protein [Patescibacteria group bacterium]